MTKAVAVLGNATTTGGRIIQASAMSFDGQKGIAVVGDLVLCPECEEGKGVIITGADNFILDGKKAAYDGCVVACGCPIGSNRIIAFSDIYIDAPNCCISRTSFSLSGRAEKLTDKQRKDIKQDAQDLINYADKLREKHLYYPNISQEFRREVERFTDSLVKRVENGSISYEKGKQDIKKEKDSLAEQSIQWVSNGLSIFGGVGQIMGGFALCGSVGGCILGGFLIAHGANNIYEGATGIGNGIMNALDNGQRSLSVDGFTREGYKSMAQVIGFGPEVGGVAYDFADLGISIHGKLKLVTKLNEFGDPRFKLFKYGRQDLERGYKQMSDKLLTLEVISDSLAIKKIKDKLSNIFVLSKNEQRVTMLVTKPEKITNVKQIVENCALIAAGKISGIGSSHYYLCQQVNKRTYQRDSNGDIINKGY
jgi:uncharacterized Zn-binding protein involved in type VI secretion